MDRRNFLRMGSLAVLGSLAAPSLALPDTVRGALGGTDNNAVGGSGIQLHVIFGNGGRVDHHVGADHIIGAVTQADLDTHLTLVADDAAIQHIAAGDLVAFCSKDLDERIHAAAAAADEVDLFYIVQQALVVIGVHEHIRQPPNK